MVLFKEYKNQKKDSFSKDPKTYDKRENVNFEEQKVNLVDDFTAEEEALRLKSEARKRKRHAVAEKNKERKQKTS